MGHDESAVVGSVLRKPQHRAGCSDFYCNPDDAYIGFHAPLEVIPLQPFIDFYLRNHIAQLIIGHEMSFTIGRYLAPC